MEKVKKWMGKLLSKESSIIACTLLESHHKLFARSGKSHGKRSSGRERLRRELIYHQIIKEKPMRKNSKKQTSTATVLHEPIEPVSNIICDVSPINQNRNKKRSFNEIDAQSTVSLPLSVQSIDEASDIFAELRDERPTFEDLSSLFDLLNNEQWKE